MEIMNFKTLTNEWLEMKKLSIKQSTYVKYEFVLEQHILPYFKDYSLKDLSLKLFISYFENKKQEDLSESLLHSIKSIISCLLNYAYELDLMDNINLHHIRIPRTTSKKRNLTKKEKNQIIKYIKNNTDSLSISMLLALYSGLRIGEICALKWSDIDFDNQILTVKSTATRLKTNNESKKTEVILLSPKSKSSYREIPLPDFIITYFKQYDYHHSSHYILSRSNKIYEPRKLEKYFRAFANEHKISCTFHCLRHHFATECVLNNVEIKALSEILGHSNVSITLNVYVHTTLEQKKKELNKLKSPRLS